MAEQNPEQAAARDLAGVPPGTVITVAFAEMLARDVYVWGWPIANAFHRRTSMAAAPVRTGVGDLSAGGRCS